MKPIQLKQYVKLLASQIRGTIPPTVVQQLVSNPALLRSLLNNLASVTTGKTKEEPMTKTEREILFTLVKAGKTDLARKMVLSSDTAKAKAAWKKLQERVKAFPQAEKAWEEVMRDPSILSNSSTLLAMNNHVSDLETAASYARMELEHLAKKHGSTL